MATKAEVMVIPSGVALAAKKLGFDRGRYVVRFTDDNGFCLDLVYCRTKAEAEAIAEKKPA